MAVAQVGRIKDESRSNSSQLLDITVLAGGPGAEREVSLESGRAVHEALSRIGHNAALCDIGPDDLGALARHADFVFIAMHGEFGEDGTIQGLLDQRRVAYAGSGTAASRMAFDKVESKRRFQALNINTPPFELLDAQDCERITRRFELPAVVKPVASGSSVDTIIARDRDQLINAAMTVTEKYGHALLERYIAGPELTVGILGDTALPVCQIKTKREFYNYQAKYLDDDTQYLFDLDLPAELIRQVELLGLAAHRALGCRVFSRVDIMVDETTSEPFVLEVNTIPGFTSHSLLPKSAARVGIGFDELCQRIVELSRNDKGSNKSSSDVHSRGV